MRPGEYWDASPSSSADDRMSHLDLTQVGKYQILDLIGEGAMGAVYRALDPVLNRIVAIKVMGDAVARNDELRDRFLREAQAAGSLQHPNVITIFDFGEVDGHLYIAMEYIEGSDLERILAQRIPLSITDKLDIAIDVLSGLAFAHKRGLVHRDIKPANIRVTEDGRAKIMDFGIVHLESSQMTRTGVAMGTPDYMAPEQVTGDRITPATDLFAMGSVLYELLTGARPFRAETLHAVMYQIVSEDPPPIDTVLPGLPPQLAPIVARALRKEPERRFASALEFANALTAVRASLAGSPKSTTLSLRTSIDSGLEESRKARTPERGSRRRRTRGARMWQVTGLAVGALAMAGVGWLVATRQGAESAPSSLDVPDPPAVAADSPAAPPSAASSQRIDEARAIAVFRALERAASQLRQDAVAAGVPGARLAAGDTIQRRAIALFGDGQLAQATTLLGEATRAWSAARSGWQAEQTARTPGRPRTTEGSRSAVTAAGEPKPSAAPASGAAPGAAPVGSLPPLVTPPITIAPAPRASATLPAPEVDPNVAAEAAIASAVAAYARAIESRDLAAVRRANPGLTTVQQNGFEQFFRAVRSLKATFTVVSSEIQGNTAEARLTGAYDFVTTNGREVHQPLSFQATLRREGTSWRLVAVR